MAISKDVINKKKQNQPQPLGAIPENNPNHRSAPIDMHHPIPPKPELYHSFEEAKNACELIFLKPGEAHTEFYKKNNEYHCVVAIGNVIPNTPHLYLTDSGFEMSIDDRLDDMNETIQWFGKTVSVLNKDVSALTDEFRQLNLNIEEFENNITTQIQIINNTVNNINTSTSNAIVDFEEFVNEKLLEIIEQIQLYNDRISLLEQNYNDLSTNISELNSKLQIESSINEIQNSSINLLNNEIILLNDEINDVHNQLSDLSSNTNSRFVEIEQHIDSSIQILENLINEFQPIYDSSIEDLFHNDIYTINLCCYTVGGHIEIFDNIAGTEMGGDSSRVAPCTPFNEYKTYVNGDEIVLSAVANENDGYEFVKWLINDNEEVFNSSISITFNNSDINCIGYTEHSKDDHKPLKHGYTAVFRRLHKLTFSFNVVAEGEYEEGAPIREIDKIEVYVRHNGEIIQHHILIDNESKQYIYVGDNESIDIKILPNISHLFEEYLINGYHSSSNPEIHYNLINNDINIEAHLTEKWVKVGADAVPADAGSIRGNMKSYPVGSQVQLEAYIINNDYVFDHWEDSNSSINLEKFIIEGDITTRNIVLNVSSSVDTFNLKGLFRQQ